MKQLGVSALRIRVIPSNENPTANRSAIRHRLLLKLAMPLMTMVLMLLTMLLAMTKV
jgi:hypothetical protein